MHTIRTALMQVDPEVPFVDSSPSNQIKTLDPYSKRWTHSLMQLYPLNPCIPNIDSVKILHSSMVASLCSAC